MGNQRLELAANQEKQKKIEDYPTPTPSPTPSPTPAASPITATPTPIPKSTPSASQMEPEILSIYQDDTKTALEGQVSVSLIGISFEGNPLHHRASFRVRTPAGSGTYERRDVGQIVTFPGYEIRLIKVDTFHAEFEVLQTLIRQTVHH